MFMAAAAAVTAALLLTSCSAISEGRITDKLYSAPYDTRTMECAFWKPATANSPMSCSYYHWVERHHEATYKFDIADGKDTGWVWVNENTYNAYEVGDWYGEEN